MYRTIMTASLLLALAVAGLAADPAPAPAKPCILIVQKDARPIIDNYDFEGGFTFLVKSLPPERPLVFVSTMNEDYTEEYSGQAGRAPWPPGGFYFQGSASATTPYRNLLRYLKDKSIRNCDVFFVSDGVSQDMLQMINPGGPLDTYSYTPDRYPYILDLVSYCRLNAIRLVGFFIERRRTIMTEEQDADTMYRDAFLYAMKATGGQAYWNFSTFKGVFKSAVKKYWH